MGTLRPTAEARSGGRLPKVTTRERQSRDKNSSFLTLDFILKRIRKSLQRSYPVACLSSKLVDEPSGKLRSPGSQSSALTLLRD